MFENMVRKNLRQVAHAGLHGRGKAADSGYLRGWIKDPLQRSCHADVVLKGVLTKRQASVALKQYGPRVSLQNQLGFRHASVPPLLGIAGGGNPRDSGAHAQ